MRHDQMHEDQSIRGIHAGSDRDIRHLTERPDPRIARPHGAAKRTQLPRNRTPKWQGALKHPRPSTQRKPRATARERSESPATVRQQGPSNFTRRTRCGRVIEQRLRIGEIFRFRLATKPGER